jgi:hypothetical protein
MRLYHTPSHCYNRSIDLVLLRNWRCLAFAVAAQIDHQGIPAALRCRFRQRLPFSMVAPQLSKALIPEKHPQIKQISQIESEKSA